MGYENRGKIKKDELYEMYITKCLFIHSKNVLQVVKRGIPIHILSRDLVPDNLSHDLILSIFLRVRLNGSLEFLAEDFKVDGEFHTVNLLSFAHL